MDQRAGRRDGGPADAAPAMHANRFPGAEAIRQPGYKSAEGSRARRKMGVWNRVRETIQSNTHGCGTFIRQVKQDGFFLFQQRNQGLNALLLDAEQLVLKPLAATRAKDNG
jgi:hypothetical protein